MKIIVKTNRAIVFSKKILRTQLMGLRLSSIKGRYTAPKVLTNSIPKAGTNLMERVLMLMPGMRMAASRTVLDWGECSSKTERKLINIKKGQFLNAHLPSHKKVIDIVDRKNIKSILMIRDPRDVVISNYKYVNEIDITHPTHKIISTLNDDNERLLAVIRGIDGAIASVDELWRRFDYWFNDSNTLIVKYEDLVGPLGGGNLKTQVYTVKNIAEHIGVNISSDEIEYIAKNIYSSKASTFRKGTVGGWKKTFNKEHIQVFKKQSKDLLIKLGYESNNDWEGS
ncbi:sulfotransferase domain-containing protein [Teredinibacter waterburyi]|uniref:sulfotransferase domain-containing protein n=1 Tax=Teredinibacter waterburyi TaxID=1500538 RepID=UPI00165F7E1D|nr:sulfotransferase domain-containing protein [Teredinibacter waterburyi]